MIIIAYIWSILFNLSIPSPIYPISKMVYHTIFLDFRIRIEHFILDDVEIRSVLVFSFLSFIGYFAVMNPLSFFISASLWIWQFISFLFNLNLIINWFCALSIAYELSFISLYRSRISFMCRVRLSSMAFTRSSFRKFYSKYITYEFSKI